MITIDSVRFPFTVSSGEIQFLLYPFFIISNKPIVQRDFYKQINKYHFTRDKVMRKQWDFEIRYFFDPLKGPFIQPRHPA